MWMGGGGYQLAGALTTLIHQLEKAYPDQEWQNSPGTGTIGDAAHRAQGSASDHNPWYQNTVRALDVALTARGPGCEALFAMVNRMYGARDPRVFGDGYAIFNGRITDWSNPGGYHAQQGDQHLTHVHISVSTNAFNATNPWPLPTTSTPAKPVKASKPIPGDDMAYLVQVFVTDCAPIKPDGPRWPGVFITDGMSLRHVVTSHDLVAFRALGMPGPQNISLLQYYGLGGK